jgi:hypothetical protein
MISKSAISGKGNENALNQDLEEGKMEPVVRMKNVGIRMEEGKDQGRRPELVGRIYTEFGGMVGGFVI